MDEECPRDEKSLNSRTKIVEYLKINKLQEANKKLKDPYPAVLEVILSYMVVNDILVKSHTFNIKAIQVQEKVVADKKMGNKQFGKLYKNIGEEYFQNSLFFQENDLQVDDAEDGELTDGTEKRFKNADKNSEVNSKRIPNTTATPKKLATKPEVEKNKKESKKMNYEDDFLNDDEDKIKEPDIEVKTKENDDIKKKNLIDDLFGSNSKEIQTNDDFDKMLKGKTRHLQEKMY